MRPFQGAGCDIIIPDFQNLQLPEKNMNMILHTAIGRDGGEVAA
jgi:hypothetical protein